YLRMREWNDVHGQLSRIVREMGFKPGETPAGDEAVHKALLPGLLSRIGMWSQEARAYVGARQTRFQLHPSSGLAGGVATSGGVGGNAPSPNPPAWVVAAELVETSQLFARVAARVDPAWLEAAGGALCKRSHGDPVWTEKNAQVMAREQVSLYGLPI